MNDLYIFSLDDFLFMAEQDLEESNKDDKNFECVNEMTPPEYILKNILTYLHSLRKFQFKEHYFELILN